MQEDRKALREALNLRIDDTLSKEIDRIAAHRGESASQVARRLLSFGAEVERRLQAQKLMQHYSSEYGDDLAGRIVIQAEFVPYTWQEAAEIQEEMHNRVDDPLPKHPRWDDLAP